MFSRHYFAVPALTLLTACASHSGVYAPDCIAYAGDRIELDNGRFVWDKFTDRVEINDEGERVDRYPDYPVRGRYVLVNDRIRFVAETDVRLPELYLVKRGRQHYLLTTAQYTTWQATGDFANCALILGDHP
jgi:hypothetical protein